MIYTRKKSVWENESSYLRRSYVDNDLKLGQEASMRSKIKGDINYVQITKRNENS